MHNRTSFFLRSKAILSMWLKTLIHVLHNFLILSLQYPSFMSLDIFIHVLHWTSSMISSPTRAEGGRGGGCSPQVYYLDGRYLGTDMKIEAQDNLVVPFAVSLKGNDETGKRDSTTRFLASIFLHRTDPPGTLVHGLKSFWWKIYVHEVI